MKLRTLLVSAFLDRTTKPPFRCAVSSALEPGVQHEDAEQAG